MRPVYTSLCLEQYYINKSFFLKIKVFEEQEEKKKTVADSPAISDNVEEEGKYLTISISLYSTYRKKSLKNKAEIR